MGFDEGLTPSQLAKAIAERKVEYEILHPETKHGAIGNGRGCEKLSSHSENSTPATKPKSKADRFTRATATATKMGESTVARLARIGTRVAPEVLKAVEKTEHHKLQYLDDVSTGLTQRAGVVFEQRYWGPK